MRTAMQWRSFQKRELKSRADERAEKRAKAQKEQRDVYRLVTARDKRKCRACLNQADPSALDMLKRGHHHHIVFRSAGGTDESSNLMLACARCHAAIHAHRLTVTGNADEQLTFSTEVATWVG